MFNRDKSSALSQILYSSWISLIILWLPLNLFYVISHQGAYVNGLLVDYLLPKIYLSDLAILPLLLVWIGESWSKINFKKTLEKTTGNKFFWVGLLLLFSFLIRQFLTSNILAASWYALKLIELFLFLFFLNKKRHVLSKKIIKIALWISLIIQASLGWFQYLTQSSLFRYHFAGEVNYQQSIGLAKDSWWQTGQILPYGTTSHPNVLAGTLVTLWLILLTLKLQTKKTNEIKNVNKLVNSILWWGGSTFVMSTLILTQSLSAFASLLIGLSLIFWWQQLKNAQWLGWLKWLILSLWLLTPFFLQILLPIKNDLPSLRRRAQLNQAATRIFFQKPLFGTGLNQFTVYLENFSQSLELVRFVQPVHHLGLLWLTETGLLGLSLIIWLVIHFRKKLPELTLPLLILAPLAALDHYLLTQQTGLLLLVFCLAFTKIETRN